MDEVPPDTVTDRTCEDRKDYEAAVAALLDHDPADVCNLDEMKRELGLS